LSAALARNDRATGDTLAGQGCRGCALRASALCGSLGEDDLSELEAMRRRKSVRPGETLVWQGERSPLVGVVVDGVLKLTVSNADGDEQIIGLVHRGDFLGRPFGGPTAYGVSAVGDANVCLFPRNRFDQLASERAQVGHRLLEATLEELERSRRWLRMLGHKTAGQKLAAFLVDFQRHAADARGDTTRIALPFTRQHIADILGLTFETVSREFSELRRRLIIDLPDSRVVVVRNRDALLRASGDLPLH
jgi:CRP/FNR family transcriptional regulator